MNVCGEFLSLQVPGLAEGRPSLLLGDKIVASLTGPFPLSFTLYGHNALCNKMAFAGLEIATHWSPMRPKIE